MLASRHGITRQSTTNAYVCLSCRLKSQKRHGHDGSADGGETGGSSRQRRRRRQEEEQDPPDTLLTPSTRLSDEEVVKSRFIPSVGTRVDLDCTERYGLQRPDLLGRAPGQESHDDPPARRVGMGVKESSAKPEHTATKDFDRPSSAQPKLNIRKHLPRGRSAKPELTITKHPYGGTIRKHGYHGVAIRKHGYHGIAITKHGYGSPVADTMHFEMTSQAPTIQPHDPGPRHDELVARVMSKRVFRVRSKLLEDVLDKHLTSPTDVTPVRQPKASDVGNTKLDGETSQSSTGGQLGSAYEPLQNHVHDTVEAKRRASSSSKQGAPEISTASVKSSTLRSSAQYYEPTFSRTSIAPSQWSPTSTLPPNGSSYQPFHARLYHSSSRDAQQAVAGISIEEPFSGPASILDPRTGPPAVDHLNGLRAQLRQWQELHGHEDPMPDLALQADIVALDEPINNFSRLSDEAFALSQAQQNEDDRDAFSHFAEIGKEGFDGQTDDNFRFLQPGDLVEIDFTRSERESILAVFVRKLRSGFSVAQFFTMQGRWMHLSEKHVQYSISGWVSQELVEPLLKHLPTAEQALDMESLMDKAYVEDLSVPREVSGPLVKRMVEFYNESQDIYRRHATALDDAHNILAHDTDLRYGSLVSAATALLKIPSDKLPLTALFTVRKALANGGFAFNIDRRSHRLTGYMQIRSKEQVKMVEQVRGWLREWQDDLAFTAGLDKKKLARHKRSSGSQHVYSFLRKVHSIVAKNRENRQPFPQSHNVGTSKQRLPMTLDKDCVTVESEVHFTVEEQDIVRFMEAWSCTTMFDGLPRLQSLPPLLLQATGLYPAVDLKQATGFMFLQEIGTIMPYENRVRFDQHLLLPSSQHSRPLQNLMNSLLSMRTDPNFQDSMADLRHDWKDLPVYCVDNADAHEIDDGISVESAGTGPDGREACWVHIHIANPTAFFGRDHPLAKMARHMGETIYMPERAYMMLPRWATQGHFSLEPNRPCLTFSAKLDASGNTLEHKITPGIIRNVYQITPEELESVLGLGGTQVEGKELVFGVGGPSPKPRARKSRILDIKGDHIQALQTLHKLSSGRAGIRRRAGGLFFDSHKPEIKVWQGMKNSGLAWDHPHRKGSRTVVGDPVIELRSRGLVNWFAPGVSVVDVLVREMMLLACEISAQWCAERQIPVIYRGTGYDPSKPDSARFWQENVAPKIKPDGTVPMHLGLQYIQNVGYTQLLTRPKLHSFLGMKYYSKATSPLRRYGDMILHWQIEAALRHEAETGKSLVAHHSQKVDRSFLPFSTPVLETIMLGLQPREAIITRAKGYAEQFWTAMLMFRRFHCGEDGGWPFLGPGSLSNGTNGLRPLYVYVHLRPEDNSANLSAFGVIMIELNVNGHMHSPANHGILDKPRQGDVWEVKVDYVDVYRRIAVLHPVRLVGREGAGMV